MITVPITPVIGTVAAGLVTATTAGSRTVTSVALFGSVVVGQKVFGIGIPLGATVTAVASTSSITISDPATATGTPTLQFSYFAATAYTAGDCLGWLFEIPMMRIDNIFIVDAAKVITAAKMYVYHSVPTPTLDNAAFAPTDADAAKLIGYYSLTGTVALANNQVIFPADAELPLAQVRAKQMYGQLVVVGTPTFAAVNEVTVNIGGE
jgi:hypothetical protein